MLPAPDRLSSVDEVTSDPGQPGPCVERPNIRLLIAGRVLTPGEAAAVLRADQSERWRAGSMVPAEEYLAAVPDLAADPEWAVELIYAEFLLREELDQSPRPEEYLQRFPARADRLRQQFELHQALVSNPGDPTESWDDQDSSTAALPGARSLAREIATAPPVITGYEILGELGRGGMGVVYKARQTSLGRTVALKMILAGLHADDSILSRFRREAEAVARLQHPNIVQIHEVGEHDGLPFLCLEYVEGGNLADRLRGAPQPARAAAALVEVLARAVHYAHARGVLHRDLKPANVLLADAQPHVSSLPRDPGAKPGPESRDRPAVHPRAPAEAYGSIAEGVTPKIADFGLAKRLETTEALTQSGSIYGTPAYMAPEQVMGDARTIGPGTDVYGLGTILYELLTGRPPFRGATVFDTIARVRAEDPLSPAALVAGVPQDLETICLKCLNKEAARRYATAQDLADDLRRFLDGRPILARPTPVWERAAKWARRRPAVSGLLFLVVAVTALGFLLVTSLWRVAESARVKADKLAREAESRADREERDRELIEAQKRQVDEATRRLALEHGLTLCDQGDVGPGLLWLAKARRRDAQLPDELSESARWNQAAWTPRLQPLVTCLDQDSEVTASAWDPSGGLIATGGADGTVRLWKAGTGQPTGSLLMTGSRVGALAFTSRGDRLFVGGEGVAQLWDVATGQPIFSPMPHPRAILAVAITPDDATGITACFDDVVRLWDLETGRLLKPMPPHPGGLRAFALGPRGATLATAGGDNHSRG